MIQDPSLIAYAEMIQALHAKWKPHAAQVEIGRPLISGDTTDVFAQCGRNFGKTDIVAYLLWRWALSHPGSENYYFAPFMKQAREILWSSQRLQSFGPRSLISSINNTEMRVTFCTGSFLKLDGSDNVEAYRGVKPKGLSVFDEFKDFRPEFYEAYDPNRAAHSSPLMIIGTPPERDCQFTQVAQEFRSNPDKRFFQFPTATNPHISTGWLKKKKAELYARGEGYVWEREYEAKFVKGGSSKIFPMLSRDMVKPHEEIIRELHRDRKKLLYYVWADPAAASCFGALFCAINPYSKKIYWLDEIYETDQRGMSVRQIGPRIISIRDDLYDNLDNWRQGYDEAATWFANEMLDHFGEHFEPSHKAASDKESGLSLLKDIMLSGRFVISDRCKKLYWELDNYYKDRNGRIPKENDHLIDCARYILAAEAYSLTDETEPTDSANENIRRRSLEDDFPEMGSGDDFVGDGVISLEGDDW